MRLHGLNVSPPKPNITSGIYYFSSTFILYTTSNCIEIFYIEFLHIFLELQSAYVAINMIFQANILIPHNFMLCMNSNCWHVSYEGTTIVNHNAMLRSKYIDFNQLNNLRSYIAFLLEIT
jgi:hypothetical protein